MSEKMQKEVGLDEILRQISALDTVPSKQFHDTDDLSCNLIQQSVNIPDGIFTEKPLVTWCCTDTTVGLHLVYFRGKPCCFTYQQGRKFDIEYIWVDQASLKEIVDYLFGLAREAFNFNRQRYCSGITVPELYDDDVENNLRCIK